MNTTFGKKEQAEFQRLAVKRALLTASVNDNARFEELQQIRRLPWNCGSRTVKTNAKRQPVKLWK